MKTREVTPYSYGRSLLDSFLGDVDNYFGGYDNFDKQLRVKTKEEDDKFIIMAEVPGISEDQINVEYKDNILSVSANYEEKDETEDYTSLRKGKYAWSCTARNIDADKISADLKNGILAISLPKSAEAKPRKILISKK